ncbi:MAG: hypothetical protein J1F22_08840 [Lachnospiraceae bacterium]|nr:hypothetical protein [Lachnospiraceae bacterium]
MKTPVRRHLAKIVVFAMMLSTAVGFTPAKKAAAADLSQYLNVEYGIKYSGETIATVNEDETAWSVEYFNVVDSSFKEGDEFYISCGISSTKNNTLDFKQIAIQSSANNWDWNAAPKKWSEGGFEGTTVVAGKITATTDGDNLAFKMQFDNETKAQRDEIDITLTDLYIMKIGNIYEEASELPEDLQVDLETPYDGTVTANLNEGAYEAQYFNVNDSSYSAGDTYIISYTLDKAIDFRQAVIQSNLNNWDWATSPKVWSGNGLAEGQTVIGDFTAAESGDGISFKIRVDSPLDEEAELPESIELALKDLIVVKVSNSTILPLPGSMMIDMGRNYAGMVDAVKDEEMGSWNVQYFNVNNSPITAGQQFKITFTVSGADAFKQLAVQSNVNGWAWDESPKLWRTEGIEDGTAFSGIITATEDCDQLTFKLWFDNPVDEDFDTTPVAMTLDNLSVSDITEDAATE